MAPIQGWHTNSWSVPYFQPMGICCMTQETQTGTLYQPRGVGWGGRWDGGSKGRGYMYTYGWFMLKKWGTCHHQMTWINETIRRWILSKIITKTNVHITYWAPATVQLASYLPIYLPTCIYHLPVFLNQHTNFLSSLIFGYKATFLL